MWGIVENCVYLHPNLEKRKDMVQFIGSSDVKIDVKGRVFFPASFRKSMQDSAEEALVMRKDVFQDCLVLYPESVWVGQLRLLRAKLNRWDKREQAVFRQFVADVELLVPDSTGRILLPRRYREMVGIEQDVRFIGMSDTIEIWAKEKADAPFVPCEEFGEELGRLMSDVELTEGEEV